MSRLLCNIFGHKWRCYMGIDSYCKRCGIEYTEYIRLNKEDKSILGEEDGD